MNNPDWTDRAKAKLARITDRGSSEQLKQMGIKAHEYATSKLDYSPGKSLLKLVLETSKI
ncbi:MAG: hypothetical protein RMX63_27055 [Aulosira sp. ZfuCHP01]|nr:hypothetical protein [Aulosira sp. ZfuVER01]MDZ8055076.1 hypothetical protein [Aulosira sp. ZfuCHP01]